MAFDDLARGRLRLRVEALVLGQPALLELGVPQVLGEPVVDLAREPRAFGQRRVRGVHLAETAQLGVGATQGGEVATDLGLDAHHQDRVEDEPQGIGRGHDPGRDDRVEREVQLAEGGHHQARGQVRVGHEPVADVQPSKEDRGDDEAGEDRDLEEHDRGRQRGDAEHARPVRIERFGAGHRRQAGLAPEQHHARQHEHERRDDHEDRRREGRRLAAEAARGADDEDRGHRAAGHRPEVDRVPRRADSAASPKSPSRPSDDDRRSSGH